MRKELLHVHDDLMRKLIEKAKQIEHKANEDNKISDRLAEMELAAYYADQMGWQMIGDRKIAIQSFCAAMEFMMTGYDYFNNEGV